MVPGKGGGFINAPVVGLYSGPSGTQSSPVKNSDLVIEAGRGKEQGGVGIESGSG